ncbi:polysaccharide pyruvyl transferase family protein [Pseudoalteromonas sp. A3]|uniref:polysaccharide pyruvyl transferase family protein n=1 Tax=Pseudoalteromonas sp. A3 TaxID=142792 RepID=UPI00221E9147|nr:polysaccharide pyruvyl transferase family protein [Pseudoalteromonas sp. A3]MCW1717700.1 polysaccharide pyruvyl transferase family protein [Pseudoalteromonas sp. A3]
MKLTYFSGHVPNFGDELNKYMWDSLVSPSFFDEDDSKLFLGIGSILWDYLPKKPKKIVMGSGYGGYTPKPDVHDSSWDIAFVRGPRTAAALNINPSLAITDAAILTHFMQLPKQSKKYKVSFMPHYESITRGNWQKVCTHAGINFIDPTNPDVLFSLSEIDKTELLITEAMHGTILADTLRVPWVALKPILPIHHNKWFDWAESLDINLEFSQMPSSSIKDSWSQMTGKLGAGKRSRQFAKVLSFTDKYYIDNASDKLLKLAKTGGQLSDDKIFELKADMALSKLSQYCDLII